jgi:hypothetical protein
VSSSSAVRWLLAARSCGARQREAQRAPAQATPRARRTPRRATGRMPRGACRQAAAPQGSAELLLQPQTCRRGACRCWAGPCSSRSRDSRPPTLAGCTAAQLLQTHVAVRRHAPTRTSCAARLEVNWRQVRSVRGGFCVCVEIHEHRRLRSSWLTAATLIKNPAQLCAADVDAPGDACTLATGPRRLARHERDTRHERAVPEHFKARRRRSHDGGKEWV